MQLSTFDNAAAFLAQAEPWLLQRLAENNLLLGIASAQRARPDTYEDPWFGVVQDGGEIFLAALRTPPRSAVLSRGSVRAMPTLVAGLRELLPDLPGVTGPREEAEAFARSWGGEGWHEAMAMRGYVLTEVLTDAVRWRGQLRRAVSADVQLLAASLAGFRRDAHLRDPGTVEDAAAGLISRGRAWLYVVEGEPVCFLAGGLDLPGTARVGMVYAPPELRGRGYGTAATAAFSAWLLEQGAERCLLLTDLANATSNAIYQRVGYRPLCEYADLLRR